MKAAIISALAGYAAAVQWELDNTVDGQYSAYANPAPTLPDFDPATVVDWWSDVYSPMLEYHAYDVAMTAWENMKADPERSPLLEVCEEGQICRDKVDDWMREEIQKTWKIVLTSLKTQIENTSLTTKSHLEEAWEKKVKCEKDFPCCEYTDEDMKNTKLRITALKEQFEAYNEEWLSLEAHRIDLMKTCPLYGFDSCETHNAEGSVCWNMSNRLDDNFCTCAPDDYEPACPITICPAGWLFDDHCCCDDPTPPPQEVAPPLKFECDQCPDGTTPTFPVCECITITEECVVCWDGSTPDIATNPTCECPIQTITYDENGDEIMPE